MLLWIILTFYWKFFYEISSKYLSVSDSKKILPIEDFINEDLLIKVDLMTIRKEHSEALKAKINIKYTNLNKYQL